QPRVEIHATGIKIESAAALENLGVRADALGAQRHHRAAREQGNALRVIALAQQVAEQALQRHVRRAQLARAAPPVERLDAHDDVERAEQPGRGALAFGARAEIEERTLLER